MSKVNINSYESEVCGLCPNWRGDSNPQPDRSNPNIYEFDRGTVGRCTCTNQTKSAYLRCSCGKYSRDHRVR